MTDFILPRRPYIVLADRDTYTVHARSPEAAKSQLRKNKNVKKVHLVLLWTDYLRWTLGMSKNCAVCKEREGYMLVNVKEGRWVRVCRYCDLHAYPGHPRIRSR